MMKHGTIFTSDVVKGVVNTKTQRLRDKKSREKLCVSESLCLKKRLAEGKSNERMNSLIL